MGEFYTPAAEKLEKESKVPINNVRASAMKNAVKDALLSFCKQDGEFAQAVVQGGSFDKCMEAVAKGEELRKQLTVAQSGAGEAAIYCKAAQENMLAAVDRLRAMHGTHPETAEKLLTGLEKILQGLSAQADGLRREWST